MERIFDMMSGIFHIMSDPPELPRPVEPTMRISPHLFAVLLAATGLATAAQAQHEAAAPAPRSANLQGEDPRKFVDNPHMRVFYELSVATLGPGAPPVDVKAYEQKSYAIFNAF